MLYDKDYIDTFCKIDIKKGIKVKNIDTKSQKIYIIFSLYDASEDLESPITIEYPLQYSAIKEFDEDLDVMEWYVDYDFSFHNLPEEIENAQYEKDDYLDNIYSILEDEYPTEYYHIIKDKNGKLIYDEKPFQ